MTDHDDRCTRCEGRGYVPFVLGRDDYGDVLMSDRDCPRCGSSGREPDPDALAERRYFAAQAGDPLD